MTGHKSRTNKQPQNRRKNAHQNREWECSTDSNLGCISRRSSAIIISRIGSAYIETQTEFGRWEFGGVAFTVVNDAFACCQTSVYVFVFVVDWESGCEKGTEGGSFILILTLIGLKCFI
jgi:hypothetical protein